MKQECNEIAELHSNQNGDTKLFKCKICKKKYKKKKFLLKHETSHIENDGNDTGDNEKNMFCKTCGHKFRFHKSLLKHEARHKGDGGFWCRTCGLCFSTSESKEKHREEQHKSLKCRICNITFPVETEFLKHINALHDGRDREMHMCSICGKQYKTKGELNHHISSKCGTVKQFRCTVCDQTLMTAGSLHNHMLRHNGDPSFMCRFCAKMFLTVGQLTVHERSHTQDKAFVCDTCGKGFCHRQSLITHQTIHTGILPYQCEGCGRAFSCVGNLLKHRKTHDDTCGLIPMTSHRVKNPETRMKVHANTPASSKLKTKERLKKIKEKLASVAAVDADDASAAETETENPIAELPRNESHPQTTENCDINPQVVCDVDLDTKLEVEEDLLDVQITVVDRPPTDDEIKIAANLSEEEKFESDSCDANDMTMDYSDSSNDSIDLMTRKIMLNKKTNGCLKKLGETSEAKIAKEAKCQTAKANSDDENWEVPKILQGRRLKRKKEILKCVHCSRTYTKLLWLKRHEKTHANDAVETSEIATALMPFKCSCCKIRFSVKEECVAHQRHMHAELLTCPDCGRIFANPDSLKNHEKTYHRGIPRKEYLYICKMCGKQFRQKTSLAFHEDSKCGTGPAFPCTLCDKKFMSKFVRKSHMRVHQPDKKLLCKYCGKSFNWKGQLKIHERSHTGEKPYKCDQCAKAFAYRESLVTHSSTHTGIKPHVCRSCGFRFSCIGNLLKHRRTHATTCGQTPIKGDDVQTFDKPTDVQTCQDSHRQKETTV